MTIDRPLFGGDYSEENSIAIFNKWKQEVIDKAPKDKLLVYEVTEGWKPLCDFLGVNVPSDAEFPHVNDTENFRKFIAMSDRQGKSIFAGIVAVACFALVAGVKSYRSSR